MNAWLGIDRAQRPLTVQSCERGNFAISPEGISMNDPIALTAAERLPLADVVARSGASAQLLHDCASLGLLGGMAHIDANSRPYDARTVSTLRFVRRAHALGFETPEVVEL